MKAPEGAPGLTGFGRKAIAWVAFPVVLTAAVGVAIALIHRGVDPRLAVLVTQLPAFLVVITLERLAPHFRIGTEIRETWALTWGIS